MIVAIDGPAGAGKSTVARELAERLGFRYLDTGAMYRSLTWLALRRGLDARRRARRSAGSRRENPVVFDADGRVSSTTPTSPPRSARCGSTSMVPVVARHPEVREVMRERQRELGAEGDVVIEGRDIGTVVAPERRGEGLPRRRPARFARARRQAERPEIGADALATDLKLRDESDRARMQPAADASEIDTTDLGDRGGRRADRGARPRPRALS